MLHFNPRKILTDQASSVIGYVRVTAEFTGMVNRRLRRAMLEILHWYARFVARIYPELETEADEIELALLFDKNAAWKRMQPLISRMPEVPTRAFFAGLATTFLWFDKQYDEARQACECWCDITEEWAKEHPDGLYTDLLKIDRLMEGNQSQRPKRGLGSWSPNSEDIARLSGSMSREYAKAHIASALLSWSAKRGDEPAALLVTAIKPKRVPIYFYPVFFDFDTAVAMGMSKKTFASLCKSVAVASQPTYEGTEH